MMSVEYRTMTRDDLAAVVALCNECFNENTPMEYAERMWAESEGDPHQVYVVGILDGQVVAHTLINIIPTIYEEMNTYAILNHVCVKPDCRRSGIGTGLLDYCFAVARDHKCKKVELWSKNFRVAAHGLYRKYGFTVMDAAFFEREV